MKNKIFYVICLLIFVFSNQIYSQKANIEQKNNSNESRGIGIKNDTTVRYTENGELREMKLYDNSYALVISMSNYNNGWSKLPGTIRDAEQVKEVLTEHGFKVQVELDLTGIQMKSVLEEFIKNYGRDPNNRLIVYYAGHGATIRVGDGREKGFLVPVNAPLTTKNEKEFIDSSLTLTKIRSLAEDIYTKHALFVFDSCFSGKLLRDRNNVIPLNVSTYLQNPVRQFITSGSTNEKVPDVSIFNEYFVKGLRGAADTNNGGDGFVTGKELFNYLKDNVILKSEKRQTPQFGIIEDNNLKDGDMVFFLNKYANFTEEKAFAEAKKENTERSYRMFITSFRNSKYLYDALDLLTKVTKKNEPIITRSPSVRKRTKLIPFKEGSETIKLNELGIEIARPKIENLMIEEELGKGIKIKLVKIPTGKFIMGSKETHEGKPLRKVTQNETPAREVTVDSFYMGIFEVTQEQWQQVAELEQVDIWLDKNPPGNQKGEKLPITGITWEEAREFCKRLSRETGRIYSLPSEAEWEYAAKANTDTPFFFGEKIKSELANFNADTKSPSGVEGFFRKQLIRVDNIKYSNGFGLFNMHGNVAEWCEDGWIDNYKNAPTNGTARVGSSIEKVVRGGSFAMPADRVCSTCRTSELKNLSSTQVGFRVVMRTRVEETN